MKPIDLNAFRAREIANGSLTSRDALALLEFADQLVGQLLKLEWASGHFDGGACLICSMPRKGKYGGHDHLGCWLNDTLNAVGFDTDEKRDAARSRMKENTP